jgi:hypothetical protein
MKHRRDRITEGLELIPGGESLTEGNEGNEGKTDS